MRKILVSQFLTLDGVMDAPEEWNSKYLGDSELINEVLIDFSNSECLLLGRTTYDFFAARWPSRTGAMADYFNTIPKVVVSSTRKESIWNNSTILTGGVDEIKKLKQLPGKNILVFGSYKLVQTLMKENLVDEYKLYTYPLTLGKGKRLFEAGATGQALKLIVAKPFVSGLISATYQPEK
jgi:dihydrofolate reductase